MQNKKNVKRFLKAVTYTDDRPRGMAKNTILEFQVFRNFNENSNSNKIYGGYRI